MKLTDCFERVYVINLPCNEGRRGDLERHVEALGIADPSKLRWIKAVSGDWCGVPEWFRAGGGAWGCLQSHVRTLQDAVMDSLENYCVLEDDAIFSSRSPALLARLMREVPGDWGQLYLGGQHLREPEPLADRPYIFRCRNVNRTHAFALRQNAYRDFHRHVMNFPDYADREGWHIDHQLGLAHEAEKWNTYAPAWWIAGQRDGESNITGRTTPRLWWNAAIYSPHLPFVYLGRAGDETLAALGPMLHFGNHLKQGTKEDIGLDACVGHTDALRKWLEMIAREALDMGLLPGIQHPDIPIGEVEKLWPAGVLPPAPALIKPLLDYPFNGLFKHPASESPPSVLQLARAV